MPGGGGVAVFRHVLERHPELARKTVFMSGELSPDLAELVGTGYAAVVEKPFKLEHMLNVIEQAIAV